jgi:hypothetical protein
MCEVGLELNNVPGLCMFVVVVVSNSPSRGPLDGTHPLEERSEGCGVARHETRLRTGWMLGIAVALTGCREVESREILLQRVQSPLGAVTLESDLESDHV